MRAAVLSIPVMVLAAALAGCAGSSPHPKLAAAAGPKSTAVAEQSGAPSTTLPAGGADPRTPGNTRPGQVPTAPAGAPTPTTSGPAPGAMPGSLPMQVALASSCVKPGSPQTVTITSQPQTGVGYMAIYANGKTGAERDGYGGNNGGLTDKQTGTWKDAWTVGAGAPPGRVKVQAVGAKSGVGQGEAAAEFAVADLTGRCG